MSRITNLIVVAHPDDEVLGCGGTGAKLASQGEDVISIIMCSRAEVRTQHPGSERLREDILHANQILGFQPPILENFPNLGLDQVAHFELVRTIEKYIRSLRPKRIFTHSDCDPNIDHEMVSRACQVASKLPHRESWQHDIPSLYFMEIASSTEWIVGSNSRVPFKPDVFCDISEFIDLKIQGLSAYTDVMRPSPHPRSEKMVKGLAAFRGAQSVSEYAESFMVGFAKDFS